MCRSKENGGRRCPSCSGDRRRAYQRERYQRLNLQAVAKKTFSDPPAQPEPQKGTFEYALAHPETVADADIEAMTPDQRQRLVAAARERIAEARGKAVASACDALGKDVANAEYELHDARYAPIYDQDKATKYQELVQSAGRDAHLASYATYLDYLDDAGLGDAVLGDDSSMAALVRERFVDDDSAPSLATYDYLDALSRRDPEWESRVAAIFGPDPDTSDKGKDEREAFINDLLNDMGVESDSFDAIMWRREARGWTGEAKAYAHLDSDNGVAIPPTTERAARCLRAKCASDINAARDEVFVEAVRDALGGNDRFGSEKITPRHFGSKTTKAQRSQFDDCVSLYPDGMVSRASKRHSSLVVKINPKMSWRTTTRGYFSASKNMAVPTPPRVVAAIPGETAGGGRSMTYPKSYEEMASKIERLREEESDYAKILTDDLNKAYPIATDESRAALQKRVDEHNQHPFAKVGSMRKPSKLVIDEFTDNDGNTRLRSRFPRKQSSGSSYGYFPVLHTDGSRSTMVHELAHMMEADAQISVATKRFLHTRTAGKEVTDYAGTDVIADGFYSPYVGRDYSTQAHTEVFSMGMESLFSAPRSHDENSHPSSLRSSSVITTDGSVREGECADVEHRDLVLGLLATFRD